MFNFIIQENYNLKLLNTFKFNCEAKYFILLDNIHEIKNLFKYLFQHKIYAKYLNNNNFLILGGGSNLLFISKFYDGIVIKINDTKLEIIDNTNIKVYAGYNWHDFVQWCVENKYYGLENLALIPGTVGAAPIQNIGAYGVEVKKYIHKIQIFNLQTLEFEYLSNQDCQFNYRDSIFKYNKHYIVVVVFFMFPSYMPNIEYKELSNYLLSHRLEINAQNIFNSIVDIRNNKLPNPKILPNAGSFFKNPIIEKSCLQELIVNFPMLIYHNYTDNQAKLSAGWLIESCGFKGIKLNNVGVYEKQALVLVNFSAYYGSEILPLVNSILNSVKDKFNILLEIEPNIIN